MPAKTLFLRARLPLYTADRPASLVSRYPLDYILFLPGIWLAAALNISVRLLGPAFVVIPTGTCFLYAILMGVKPPRVLSLYYILCVCVALLSYYHVFPTSWQVHYVPEAVVRQLAPLTSFFAVAWASKAYFRRRLKSGTVFADARPTVILGILVSPMVMIQQGTGYQGDHSVYAAIALMGSFINNTAIASVFLLGAVIFARGWRRYMAAGYIFAVAATTHFAQFRLFALILIATLCGFPGRRAAVAGLALLFMAYAVGMKYIPETVASNPNDGLRLQLVYDAFVSAGDTYGIGIGYGKESVRWVYHFPGVPPFTFLPDAASMSPSRMLEALSTGVENSFVEALLRTGVVGCFLLTWAFLNTFPIGRLPKDVRNHAALLFFVLFACCFVNSTLESPISSVGVGFIYGYLVALRARARVCVPRITWDDEPT